MRLYKNGVFFLCMLGAIVGVTMMGVASAQEANSVIAKDAKVVKLSEAFKFTEGPACDAAGNVIRGNVNEKIRVVRGHDMGIGDILRGQGAIIWTSAG